MARAFTNYYHTFVQSVPAVDWSLRNLQAAETALLSGHLNGTQTCLRFLSCPSTQVALDLSRDD